MVSEYLRAADLEEALNAMRDGYIPIAGGTGILSGYIKNPDRLSGKLVDIASVLPGTVERSGMNLRLGAGLSFQDLMDSEAAYSVLKAAAATMANRNTRNRATIGGNLAANKSCASLIPILLALGAKASWKAYGEAETQDSLEAWLADRRGLLLSVELSPKPGTLAAAGRVSRTACDVATCTAALAYRLEGGTVRNLKLALGGFGPRAELRPDIASLFEGKNIPGPEESIGMIKPLLKARSDQRGSAEYKQLRGAVLVAELLGKAEVAA